MASPLEGGELLDPHGGRGDLERRLVRMVSPQALEDDPLRSLRAVRIAVELELEIEAATGRAVSANARGIERVAPERVFAELKRVIGAEAVRRGLALMEAHGLTAVVLPELLALKGLEQSHFHHADVHDHTLEVLDQVAILQRRYPLLAEPLSDELTRGQAMRWAALLHDAAKPQTRDFRPDGRVTFLGHDVAGAQLARDVLGAPALLAEAARLRRRARRPSPRRRLPRPPAPARPAHDLALPGGDAALQRGHHDLHRRRPPRHPGPQRRGGDRGPPRGHRRADRRRARAGRQAAGPRGRAGADRRRPAPGGDPRPARGGSLRGRDLHSRGGARAGRGARVIGDDSARGLASQEGLAWRARPSAARRGGT